MSSAKLRPFCLGLNVLKQMCDARDISNLNVSIAWQHHFYSIRSIVPSINSQFVFESCTFRINAMSPRVGKMRMYVLYHLIFCKGLYDLSLT